MNKLDTISRAQVLRCLVDGNSIRGTVRITGVAKNTVVKLLADVGCAVSEFQDRTLRNLTCKRIQVDEIWSFCGMKDKQVVATAAQEIPPGWMPPYQPEPFQINWHRLDPLVFGAVTWR